MDKKFMSKLLLGMMVFVILNLFEMHATKHGSSSFYPFSASIPLSYFSELGSHTWREGDAGNPGGAWRRVRRRMTTRFSRQVDRWTTRPSGWRVDQEDDLEVRNLRRRVGFFRRQLRRMAQFRVTGFLGFPYGRPRSTPVWLVSSGEGLICIDL